jgi:hypothetical protein
MLHYHGTPITPISALESLRGRNFCVSFARPDQIETVKRIAQCVMYDNGAFSCWRTGKTINWEKYYSFIEKHISLHNDWAVIPDVIDGDEKHNDYLLSQWPMSRNIGAPVWHLHESMFRLHNLAYAGYKRLCFGSSGKYRKIGSPEWMRRVETAFNMLCPNGGQPPIAIHMLRGISMCGSAFPFSSADSTNIARNHKRQSALGHNITDMASDIDGINCPLTWGVTEKLDESFIGSVCVWDFV